MYICSMEADAALKNSHTRKLVAEVFSGFGPLIASSYGTPKVYVVGGNIRVERRASFSRKFEARIIDSEGIMVPSATSPYLDPLRRPQITFSFEIGWVDNETGQNMTERIPVGRYVLEDADVEEVEGGAMITCSGRSRSILIAQNPWTGPYQPTAGSTYAAAIQGIINDRKPAAWTPEYRFDVSTATIPTGMAFGGDDRSDPWAEAQKLAEADGKELFDDSVGAIVLRTVPSVESSLPAWHYDQAPESTRLPGLQRSIHGDDIYNGVIVRGTAPWLLYNVQGVAWDTEPTSPTYYNGPFGRRPKMIDDAAVTNQAQATAAAAAELRNVLGVTEEVNFTTIPNPCHEHGDIVRVASAQTALDDVAMLEAFTLPFNVADAMQATIRRKRVT